MIRLLRKRDSQVDQEFGDIAFTRVVEPMLKNVPEDLRAILTSITHLRKFNANPLKQMLGPEFEEKAGVFYFDSIRRMRESRLVEWSCVDGGYVVSPTVRKIIDRNLMVRNLKAYIERHTHAADMYGAWLEEHPRSGASSLIEQAYHQAQVLNAQGLSQDEIVQSFELGLETIEKSLRAGIKPEKPKSEVSVRIDLQNISDALQEGLEKDTELLTEALEPEVAERVKDIATDWLQQLN